MRDPLQRYLRATYFYWYVPLLAFGTFSALPLGSLIVYVLGPLAALFSPIALFGVVFKLKARREIEALQAYGVSFPRFWQQLSVAAAIPAVVICMAATAIAPRHALAATMAAVAVAASSGAFALVARRAWRSTIR